MSSERRHNRLAPPLNALAKARMRGDERDGDEQGYGNERRLARMLRERRGSDAQLLGYLSALALSERWLARIVAIRELGAGRTRELFERLSATTNPGYRPWSSGETPGDAAQSTLRVELAATFGPQATEVELVRDAEADGAEAVTRDARAHFASGQFDPHSREGRIRLGHEVAHALQQRRGSKEPNESRAPVPGTPRRRRALEEEAEEAGRAFAAHRAFAVKGSAPRAMALYRGDPATRFPAGAYYEQLSTNPLYERALMFNASDYDRFGAEADQVVLRAYLSCAFEGDGAGTEPSTLMRSLRGLTWFASERDGNVVNVFITKEAHEVVSRWMKARAPKTKAIAPSVRLHNRLYANDGDRLTPSAALVMHPAETAYISGSVISLGIVYGRDDAGLVEMNQHPELSAVEWSFYRVQAKRAKVGADEQEQEEEVPIDIRDAEDWLGKIGDAASDALGQFETGEVFSQRFKRGALNVRVTLPENGTYRVRARVRSDRFKEGKGLELSTPKFAVVAEKDRVRSAFDVSLVGEQKPYSRDAEGGLHLQAHPELSIDDQMKVLRDELAAYQAFHGQGKLTDKQWRLFQKETNEKLEALLALKKETAELPSYDIHGVFVSREDSSVTELSLYLNVVKKREELGLLIHTVRLRDASNGFDKIELHEGAAMLPAPLKATTVADWRKAEDVSLNNMIEAWRANNGYGLGTVRFAVRRHADDSMVERQFDTHTLRKDARYYLQTASGVAGTVSLVGGFVLTGGVAVAIFGVLDLVAMAACTADMGMEVQDRYARYGELHPDRDLALNAVAGIDFAFEGAFSLTRALVNAGAITAKSAKTANKLIVVVDATSDVAGYYLVKSAVMEDIHRAQARIQVEGQRAKKSQAEIDAEKQRVILSVVADHFSPIPIGSAAPPDTGSDASKRVVMRTMIMDKIGREQPRIQREEARIESEGARAKKSRVETDAEKRRLLIDVLTDTLSRPQLAEVEAQEARIQSEQERIQHAGEQAKKSQVEIDSEKERAFVDILVETLSAP